MDTRNRTNNRRHVRVSDLAEEFGKDRSSLRKFLIKHGMAPFKEFAHDAAGHLQECMFVTAAHADRVRRMMRKMSDTNKSIPGVQDVGIVAYVSEPNYRFLTAESRKRDMTIGDIIRRIVENAIEDGKNAKTHAR